MRKIFEIVPHYLGAMHLLTGHATDAILLYCLWSFEQSTKSLKDHKGEEGWFAFTRDQWMLNTGLTLHQYNRSISRLKKSGFIVFQSRRLKRTDKGRRILWMKINKELFPELDAIVNTYFCVHGGKVQKRSDCADAIPTRLQNCTIATSETGGRVAEKRSISKRNKTGREKNKEKKCNPLNADSQSLPLDSNKNFKGKRKLKIKNDSKSKIESKNLELNLPKKFSGTKGFEEYFRIHFHAKYPNRKFGWIRYEREGVARQIVKRIKAIQLSSALVIKDVILNWDEYKSEIDEFPNGKTYSYPRVETIYSNLQTVINFYQKRMRENRADNKERRLNDNYKRTMRRLREEDY